MSQVCNLLRNELEISTVHNIAFAQQSARDMAAKEAGSPSDSNTDGHATCAGCQSRQGCPRFLGVRYMSIQTVTDDERGRGLGLISKK